MSSNNMMYALPPVAGINLFFDNHSLSSESDAYLNKPGCLTYKRPRVWANPKALFALKNK